VSGGPENRIVEASWPKACIGCGVTEGLTHEFSGKESVVDIVAGGRAWPQVEITDVPVKAVLCDRCFYKSTGIRRNKLRLEVAAIAVAAVVAPISLALGVAYRALLGVASVLLIASIWFMAWRFDKYLRESRKEKDALRLYLTVEKAPSTDVSSPRLEDIESGLELLFLFLSTEYAEMFRHLNPQHGVETYEERNPR